MDPSTLPPWAQLLLAATLVIVVAQVVHRIGRPIVLRLAAFSPITLAVVKRCDKPVQFALPLVALQLVLQGFPADTEGLPAVQRVTGVLAIAAVTWIVIAAIRGFAEGIVALHPAEVADNLHARRIQTQARVLSRIACSIALLAGTAFILMTFPTARQFGTSLLASAGVAGLVVGIAARSVFSNLLAGLQIALAQPIRIDDVLVLEGEWGRVEEITATYVVLKIWDERRLIVPLGWFIEHPFQNWTRTSADILGTVHLWLDHRVPVDAIRAEAQRLCEASPLWDRRVCVVQVTETSERAMQVRVLVSSASSGPNFDLRCELREKLIAFVQREHPEGLPRLRAEVETRPR